MDSISDLPKTDEISPKLLYMVQNPFRHYSNFLKGCKWAPDGSCLLTCSEDTVLRIFNIPTHFCSARDPTTSSDGLSLPSSDSQPPEEHTPARLDDLSTTSEGSEADVACEEGELVYDYCWYPLMSSYDPSSCCFVSTCRDHPIHLYDAFTGDLRATYRAYNNVDEVAAAYSVQFSGAGEQLLAGFSGWVCLFDVATPGRPLSKHPLKVNGVSGQSGVVSCFSFSPTSSSVYAAGTYTRTIGLYSMSAESPLCVLEGHKGGVTHLMFSDDGNTLYSGARRDGELLCWDMRWLGQILFSMNRTVLTNQRIYFDLSPHNSQPWLYSGGSDGVVRCWNLTQCHTGGQQQQQQNENHVPPSCQFRAHSDCCNGVSCNPAVPLLATSSGQRHLPADWENLSEDSDTASDCAASPENSVKLWLLPKCSDSQG